MIKNNKLRIIKLLAICGATLQALTACEGDTSSPPAPVVQVTPSDICANNATAALCNQSYASCTWNGAEGCIAKSSLSGATGICESKSVTECATYQYSTTCMVIQGSCRTISSLPADTICTSKLTQPECVTMSAYSCQWYPISTSSTTGTCRDSRLMQTSGTQTGCTGKTQVDCNNNAGIGCVFNSDYGQCEYLATTDTSCLRNNPNSCADLAARGCSWQVNRCTYTGITQTTDNNTGVVLATTIAQIILEGMKQQSKTVPSSAVQSYRTYSGANLADPNTIGGGASDANKPAECTDVKCNLSTCR